MFSTDKEFDTSILPPGTLLFYQTAEGFIYDRDTQFLPATHLIGLVVKEQKEGPLRVILGNHWAQAPGWKILKEADQDITKPLQFADGSVECLFMEHVLEHVGFGDALKFFKEAYRVLKLGGVLRIVSPDLDKLVGFMQGRKFDDRDLEYIKPLGDKYAIPEHLRSHSTYNALLINDLVREHGHKFVWNIPLLATALEECRFHAKSFELGKGTNSEFCLERRRRGLRDEIGQPYDCESFYVEGIKE
jgi:SAM-dependent methyltransferase